MSTITTAITYMTSAFLMFVAGAFAIAAKYQSEYYSKLIQPPISKMIFYLWWLPWGLAVVTLLGMTAIIRAQRTKALSAEQSNAISISVLSGSIAFFVLYIIGALLGFSKLWTLLN